MKMMKALVCLFALAAVLAGGITMMTPKKAYAKNCCGYFMVCTVSPPIVCWEVCMPCYTFP